ncbi:hypothetical protein GQ600_25878 [Phytophthora cactorum]|nr:hypothetical protein GQ600_25878 [Phytophthora cactorum]
MVIGGVCGLHRQRTPLHRLLAGNAMVPTFAMVERYFKLKPFLDSVDDELASDGEGPLLELFGSPGPISSFPFREGMRAIQNGETRI